jgi:hypothetical protein
MTAESRVMRAADVLLVRLDGLPVEALYRAPSSAEWPVMSILAHVVEMLPYWATQCRRIVRQPGISFGRDLDDPGRLEAIAAHAQDPVEVVRTSLRTAVDEALATLRAIPESERQAMGQHVRRGPMSAARVIDELMVSHVEEHVAQVDATLRELGYSPSQVP